MTPYSLLHFEVEDTGVGIDPEEMAQLFDPFSQTQSGFQVREGTGLGLPISRQFVQLMGGDISVQSTPLKSSSPEQHPEPVEGSYPEPLEGGSQGGHGSTFSFDIPLELAYPSEIEPERPSRRVIGLAPASAGSAADGPVADGPYRILVVDDSAPCYSPTGRM